MAVQINVACIATNLDDFATHQLIAFKVNVPAWSEA